jgi:hypothetical protein
MRVHLQADAIQSQKMRWKKLGRGLASWPHLIVSLGLIATLAWAGALVWAICLFAMRMF